MATNAESVTCNVRGAVRQLPRHREIWIRLNGLWVPGVVTAWMLLDGRRFATVEYYLGDGGPVRVGNFWYNDGAAIQQRVEGERPIE